MHFRNIAVPLALASPALGGILAHTTTSTTVSLWVDDPTPAPVHEPEPTHEQHKPTPTQEHHKPTSSCPHPKDFDRHWDDERILNDTTKHHSNFHLFATPNNAEYSHVRFPLHLKEHEDRKDIWTLNLTLHIPQGKIAEDQQPKWNLKSGGLQTDNSAPINDLLYLRLFETSWKRDTRAWAEKKKSGVFFPVLTTNPNKKTYQREHNAKLLGRDGWQLTRDGESLVYTLSNKKFAPGAGFVVCTKDSFGMDDVISGPMGHEDEGAARDIFGDSAVDAYKKGGHKPSDASAVVVDIIYADKAAERPWENIEGHDFCFPVTLKTEIKNTKKPE